MRRFAQRSGLAELTIEDRQQLLGLLVESVRIEAKNIRIEVVLPSVDPQAVYRLRPKHSPPSPPIPLRRMTKAFM